MKSSDITIIMLTANKVPKGWAKFHKEKLLEAINGAPIITISKEPLDWGMNLLQTEGYGPSNIYFQMLKGAKIATTDFIAMAEDDVLYPKEHFEYRPPQDSFAYNHNRLNLFNWGKPTYFWKNRMGNFTLIAPRKLLIEALEERFKKYPQGTLPHRTGELGRETIEHGLGLTHYKAIWFFTDISVIHIDHELSLDRLARSHRKRMGIMRSYDIPYWGRAEDIVKKFV